MSIVFDAKIKTKTKQNKRRKAKWETRLADTLYKNSFKFSFKFIISVLPLLQVFLRTTLAFALYRVFMYAITARSQNKQILLHNFKKNTAHIIITVQSSPVQSSYYSIELSQAFSATRVSSELVTPPHSLRVFAGYISIVFTKCLGVCSRISCHMEMFETRNTYGTAFSGTWPMVLRSEQIRLISQGKLCRYHLY